MDTSSPAMSAVWRVLRSALLASMIVGGVGAHGVLAQPAPPSSERFVRPGLYVVATDLAASAAFYERVFGKPPSLRTASFVGFDVAGGLFGIALRGRFAPNSRIGGNVVPYIRVANIDTEFAHVRRVWPGALLAGSVTREGPLALFKFKDPDGNVVEYFALTSSR